MQKNTYHRWLRFFLLVLGIFLISLFIGWVLGSRNLVIGFPGDPSGSIWSFWWAKSHSASLFAPTQLVPYLTSKALIIFLEPVVIYNTLMVAGSLLTGVMMYLLVKYLTSSSITAVLCGIIYALMPGRQAQMYQHLSLSDWFWYPLILLLFIKLGKKPTWWNGMLLSVAAVLSVADSYYNLILIIPLVIAGVIWLIYEWQGNRMNWKYAIGSFACFVGAVTIMAWPLLHGLSTSASAQPFIRTTNELSYYSARWWSYLLPSIDHPWFGKMIEGYIQTHLNHGNAMETNQFLTWTLLAVIVVRLIVQFATPASLTAQKKAYTFAVLIVLTGLIFSIAPARSLFGVHVLFPGEFLHQYLPMFRVYARFGFMVATGAVILYAMLTHVLSKKIQILLFAIIIFECAWTVPITSHAAPPVINELARYRAISNSNESVLEFPYVGKDELRTNQYLYWQTIHGLDLINQHDIPTPSIYDTFGYEKLSVLLQGYHPTFIIVHHDLYEEGRLPAAMRKYADPQYSLNPTIWQSKPDDQWFAMLGYNLVYSDNSASLWRLQR